MWTKAQIDEHNRRVAAAEATARSLLPHAKPQPYQAPALEPPTQGAAPGLGKVVVRFVGRRTHLLDPDNYAASVKDLLDGLSHAQLIPGDSPEQIVLITEQEKVRHLKDEMTIIEVEYP
jgi:hypothetical protein